MLAGASGARSAEDGWIEMPAGGKPAYMGIHGGTMPVSLLVSPDGTSLYTFVGRTGNDFLEVLRESYTPLPSFGNTTRPSPFSAKLPGASLFAGSAASMPVISLPGDIFRGGWLEALPPFGLTSEPAAIEGQITMPASPSPAKRYRLFALPNFFEPRRSGK
ncbi:MAG: hypothetical protein K2H64_02195 [Desulfovibrio sp.]|nr:hypothetical protein [Desulfovibrio sp.]